MRQFLNDLVAYLGTLVKSGLSGWNTFFFTPADPTCLGLMRIAVGVLAFWSLFVFGLDLDDYFGAGGWADPDAIHLLERPLSWSYWFLVSDNWLRPVWLLSLAALALFSAGIFSRVTAVLAWVIVVSTGRRVPIALFGFDQVLSAMAFYLAVTGASGQTVSVDRLQRRWRQARKAAARVPKHHGNRARVMPDEPGSPRATISANLALRLIQLHLIIIYGMAGLAKVQGPSWWEGTALWKTMATGEFVVLNFTVLAAWPRLVNLLTHASLAVELLYPALIWVKILRPLVLAAVVGLHVGIAVVSPGLAEFTLIMLAANLAFVSGPWVRGLVTGLHQPGLTVLYDGACPRCRKTMALVTAADPDHVIEPVDLMAVDVSLVHPSLAREKCLQSMHVVAANGQITAGFDAVRTLTGRVPLFWPLAAIACLPGLAWLGRRVYNVIAANRPRDVLCTDEVCGIHSRTLRMVPRNQDLAQ